LTAFIRLYIEYKKMHGIWNTELTILESTATYVS